MLQVATAMAGFARYFFQMHVPRTLESHLLLQTTALT